MIKLAPTKCNHCSNTLFYELNQSEKDNLNESES